MVNDELEDGNGSSSSTEFVEFLRKLFKCLTFWLSQFETFGSGSVSKNSLWASFPLLLRPSAACYPATLCYRHCFVSSMLRLSSRWTVNKLKQCKDTVFADSQQFITYATSVYNYRPLVVLGRPFSSCLLSQNEAGAKPMRVKLIFI